MKFKTSIGRFGLALAGASLAASAIAGTVTSDRLINSEKEPGNWLNHHGNYEAHRFSGLSQINKENVKDLKVAFTFAMGGTQGGGKEVIAFPFAGLVWLSALWLQAPRLCLLLEVDCYAVAIGVG